MREKRKLNACMSWSGASTWRSCAAGMRISLPRKRSSYSKLKKGAGGGRRCRNLHAPLLGALLAHEVHPEKRGVARLHARSARQIAQHAAPRALAVDGAVALQPAAVSNERVAQEDGFSERGVAQRRQQAAGGGGIKSAGAGGV